MLLLGDVLQLFVYGHQGRVDRRAEMPELIQVRPPVVVAGGRANSVALKVLAALAYGKAELVLRVLVFIARLYQFGDLSPELILVQSKHCHVATLLGGCVYKFCLTVAMLL